MIADRLQVEEHRLQVEEHNVGLEVVVNVRVKMSIFGPFEFLCVFIGWLECETCCRGVCSSLSPLPLSQWRFERREPVWSTWLLCLGGVVLVGWFVDWFNELCDSCPRRLVCLFILGGK